MISLLKKLLERRRERLTLLLFHEENPHHQDSYHINPGKMFLGLAGLNLIILLIVLGILYATPVGTYLFNKENRAIRSSVLEVRERITALQDTLKARDEQLAEIQRVIRDQSDTSFAISASDEWSEVYGEQEQPAEVVSYQISDSREIELLDSDQIIHSDVFRSGTQFPAEPPVRGTVTNTYQPDKGHFGIDIAARTGADVRSVADGVVINSEWTLNNGYVLQILHGDGFVTVFKHFSVVNYTTGDVIKKGDVVGKVGETGLLASGPHIHFEIWKNGASLDPGRYLNVN